MKPSVRFTKGHGTENDFVVIPDPDGRLNLPPSLVAALCDRRAGIGADGVLRVVRTAALPEAGLEPTEAEWFMDYRNADGSAVEMCGNGARVFARYLHDVGWVEKGRLTIGTRGGVRTVRFEDSGEITVDMGPARTPARIRDSRVSVGSRSWPATGVLLPNPHAVAFVDDLAEAGPLLEAPVVSPAAAYPDGVNVEFVVRRDTAHVALRVHERGVGETRSCGTGACAAAVAARRRAGDDASSETDRTWVVDVPGGRLTVSERPDGNVELTGPAVLVADGRLRADWVESPQ